MQRACNPSSVLGTLEFIFSLLLPPLLLLLLLLLLLFSLSFVYKLNLELSRPSGSNFFTMTLISKFFDENGDTFNNHRFKFFEILRISSCHWYHIFKILSEQLFDQFLNYPTFTYMDSCLDIGCGSSIEDLFVAVSL